MSASRKRSEISMAALTINQPVLSFGNFLNKADNEAEQMITCILESGDALDADATVKFAFYSSSDSDQALHEIEKELTESFTGKYSAALKLASEFFTEGDFADVATDGSADSEIVVKAIFGDEVSPEASFKIDVVEPTLLVATEWGGEDGNIVNHTIQGDPQTILVDGTGGLAGQTITIDVFRIVEDDEGNETKTEIHSLSKNAPNDDDTPTLVFSLSEDVMESTFDQEGEYEVVATVQDQAGNQGTGTHEITADFTAPDNVFIGPIRAFEASSETEASTEGSLATIDESGKITSNGDNYKIGDIVEGDQNNFYKVTGVGSYKQGAAAQDIIFTLNGEFDKIKKSKSSATLTIGEGNDAVEVVGTFAVDQNDQITGFITFTDVTLDKDKTNTVHVKLTNTSDNISEIEQALIVVNVEKPSASVVAEAWNGSQWTEATNLNRRQGNVNALLLSGQVTINVGASVEGNNNIQGNTKVASTTTDYAARGNQVKTVVFLDKDVLGTIANGSVTIGNITYKGVETIGIRLKLTVDYKDGDDFRKHPFDNQFEIDDLTVSPAERNIYWSSPGDNNATGSTYEYIGYTDFIGQETQNGSLTFSVAANRFTDFYGNQNESFGVNSTEKVTYDPVAPTVGSGNITFKGKSVVDFTVISQVGDTVTLKASSDHHASRITGATDSGALSQDQDGVHWTLSGYSGAALSENDSLTLSKIVDLDNDSVIYHMNNDTAKDGKVYASMTFSEKIGNPESSDLKDMFRLGDDVSSVTLENINVSDDDLTVNFEVSGIPGYPTENAFKIDVSKCTVKDEAGNTCKSNLSYELRNHASDLNVTLVTPLTSNLFLESPGNGKLFEATASQDDKKVKLTAISEFGNSAEPPQFMTVKGDNIADIPIFVSSNLGSYAVQHEFRHVVVQDAEGESVSTGLISVNELALSDFTTEEDSKATYELVVGVNRVEFRLPADAKMFDTTNITDSTEAFFASRFEATNAVIYDIRRGTSSSIVSVTFDVQNTMAGSDHKSSVKLLANTFRGNGKFGNSHDDITLLENVELNTTRPTEFTMDTVSYNNTDELVRITLSKDVPDVAKIVHSKPNDNTQEVTKWSKTGKKLLINRPLTLQGAHNFAVILKNELENRMDGVLEGSVAVTDAAVIDISVVDDAAYLNPDDDCEMTLEEAESISKIRVSITQGTLKGDTLSLTVNNGTATSETVSDGDNFKDFDVSMTTKGVYTVVGEFKKGGAILASLEKTFVVAQNIDPEIVHVEVPWGSFLNRSMAEASPGPVVTVYSVGIADSETVTLNTISKPYLNSLGDMTFTEISSNRGFRRFRVGNVPLDVDIQDALITATVGEASKTSDKFDIDTKNITISNITFPWGDNFSSYLLNFDESSSRVVLVDTFGADQDQEVTLRLEPSIDGFNNKTAQVNLNQSNLNNGEAYFALTESDMRSFLQSAGESHAFVAETSDSRGNLARKVVPFMNPAMQILDVNFSFGESMNSLDSASDQTLSIITSNIPDGHTASVSFVGPTQIFNTSSAQIAGNKCEVNLPASSLTEEGSYQMTAEITTAKETLSLVKTFERDTQHPTIEDLADHFVGSDTNDATISIEVLAQNTEQPVRVHIVNETVSGTGDLLDGSADVSLDVSTLDDGVYTMIALADDAAGNVAAIKSSKLYIDRTAPATSIHGMRKYDFTSADFDSHDSFTDSSDLSSNKSVILVNVENGALSWRYSTDGGVSYTPFYQHHPSSQNRSPYWWDPDTSTRYGIIVLEEGQYGDGKVVVETKDMAGNTNSTILNDGFTLNIDLTPPDELQHSNSEVYRDSVGNRFLRLGLNNHTDGTVYTIPGVEGTLTHDSDGNLLIPFSAIPSKSTTILDNAADLAGGFRIVSRDEVGNERSTVIGGLFRLNLEDVEEIVNVPLPFIGNVPFSLFNGFSFGSSHR